ncbi:MAG: hypothetical protein LBP67_09610 [Bacteroidales bacterium]|jgi:hypothetical protein|nr:hypothetical protein [Bacteroidales bacterium]
MSSLQREFKIFNVRPLSGVINIPKIEKFNFKNYYDFSFQESVEKTLETSFGFRESLIRLYNQYTWDFYKKTPSTKVLVGKDNWLFPNWHLHATPYSKELTANFDRQAHYLYQLSNILKEYNTHLLVCFIPSKTEIYKEYINKNINIDSDFNPIDYYCNKFDENGVNYINLTKMFYDVKDTAIFNSFPQTGTHWSNIMSVYAADSIFNIFRSLSGINMPKLKIEKPYTANVRNPDNDLELILNLYRPIKQKDNYYVDVEIIEDSASIHPKMITMGDSHFWNLSYSLPLDKIFSEYPYWYYANTIYYDDQYSNINQVNMVDELINSDFILIMYSAYQTYFLSSYFSEWSLISLCIDSIEIEKTINNIINNIKSNPQWFEGIQIKAVKDNKTLEKTLYTDALYMVKQNPYKYFPQLDIPDIPDYRSKEIEKVLNSPKSVKVIKEKNQEDRINEIMNNMFMSNDWIKSLKKKAKSANKSLEEVMREDAIWMIEHENNK